MQTYPVDIDPGQVARWVKAECEVAVHFQNIGEAQTGSARNTRSGRNVSRR